MSDLTVIVPSRGRPENIDRLTRAFQATCRADTALVVAVDVDDPELSEYQRVCRHHAGAFTLQVGPRLRLVGTLNAAAAGVTSPYVGFMGDDHWPITEGWDAAYIEALDGIAAGGVVWGNDCIQGATMPTQVALDRRIVDTLGYMVPPVLVHLCADLFWKAIGDALGTSRYLPAVTVQHLHPITGAVDWDPLYVECNSDEQSTADAKAYAEYLAGPFEADVAKLKEAFRG